MRNALARSQDSLRMPASFTAPDPANFIAAKTVATVTSYLDGRSTHASLARRANCIALELQMVGNKPRCNAIADPTRMLVVAMAKTSVDGAGRWAAIMAALVPLLRKRSLQMRAGDFPGDNAPHDAVSDDDGIVLGAPRL